MRASRLGSPKNPVRRRSLRRDVRRRTNELVTRNPLAHGVPRAFDGTEALETVAAANTGLHVDCNLPALCRNARIDSRRLNRRERQLIAALIADVETLAEAARHLGISKEHARRLAISIRRKGS